ncbi:MULTISPECIES: calcium/proton exchanger [unclassified Synechocystis]|uniref:calcium/proton exchanger n=1 Tax=unclassified Synechocystis TaxID=2640012 RepID=UPI00048D7B0E|nr:MULTISPECIES: calcium/proton exchanger [unclassified Synechocystis]MCT0253654.1 calcium/proton exchanger [Synechocystis sp. CS-94]
MSTKSKIFLILLVFCPLSWASHWLGWGETTVFILAGLAIVPLAAFMGTATEEIAVVIGPNAGGLLNATFGNATELILAYIALKEGLIDVVKATLTGSIIGNLLLVMGFAVLLGGLRYKEQSFQPIAARLNASTMNLGVVAILLPTALQYTSTGVAETILQNLSVAVAVVLIGVYMLSLVFSMGTHAYLYDVGLAENMEMPEAGESLPTPEPPTEEEKPNLWLWTGVLLAVTLGVAVESELLVGSLEVATESLGLTPLFTGVILLPIIGNAAEHATAVTVAMKDKMDLSMSVVMGSSLQIAFFVAPVLVIIGWAIGQPMDLNFNPFELVAVLVAVLIVNSISGDGSSNWLEGVLLLATYAIIALAFYFHPTLI